MGVTIPDYGVRSCVSCREEYRPRAKNQRYCTKRCKKRAEEARAKAREVARRPEGWKPKRTPATDYVCPVTGYRGLSGYKKAKCRCDGCRAEKASRKKVGGLKWKAKWRAKRKALVPRCCCYEESKAERKRLEAEKAKEASRAKRRWEAVAKDREDLAKATEVHKGKFTYHGFTHGERGDRHIVAICPEHGFFTQDVSKHLAGQQCYECGRAKGFANLRKTFDQWLVEAKDIHGDRYDYSEVEWAGTRGKIRIICQEHGAFMQGADVHVKRLKRPDGRVEFGCGCPKCYASSGERDVAAWLDENGIRYVREWKHDKCRHKYRLRFDFFLPDHNTIIEFDGMQHFIASFGKTPETRVENLKRTQMLDSIKDQFARDYGFRMIRIPYTEQARIPKILTGVRSYTPT